MNIYEEVLEIAKRESYYTFERNFLKEQQHREVRRKDLQLAHYTGLYEKIMGDNRYQKNNLRLEIQFIKEQILRLGGKLPTKREIMDCENENI